MQRSNVGNSTTNAVQTLGVAVTTAYDMKLAKDRADLALNERQSREKLNQARVSELESRVRKNDAQADASKARAERTKQIIAEKEEKKALKANKDSISIDDIMRNNSDQIYHVKEKGKRDIEWVEYYKKLREPLGDISDLLGKGDKL